MFGTYFSKTMYEAAPGSDVDEDDAFLRPASKVKTQKGFTWTERTIWVVLVIVLLSHLVWSNVRVIKASQRGTYETGFVTEFEPSNTAIALKEVHFSGGIIVNSTGQFELVLNDNARQYVGRPTAALDQAWDDLVGKYITVSEQEAASIRGQISREHDNFYIVPHVRHSLHCVNYLRKALYHKYYPTILTESRDRVPEFFTHVDHCIETLRETVQCAQDMTPVPHIWSSEKGMFLANTMLPHTCRDFDKLVEWQNEREAQDMIH